MSGDLCGRFWPLLLAFAAALASVAPLQSVLMPHVDEPVLVW